MKYEPGDRVRVVGKRHPWRSSAKWSFIGNVGVVLERKYVSKSREVPNGIIIVVKIGTKKAHFPTRYLEKVLTEEEKHVTDIL